MAVQHLDPAITRPVLPEALARFSNTNSLVRNDPLQPIALAALGVDSLLIALAMSIGFTLRGTGEYPVQAAIAILLVWLTSLSLRKAYDSGRIGVGSEEFKNVLAATFGTFAFFACLAFVLEITDGRRFIIGTFAAGVVLLPLGRRALRSWVFRKRRAGELLRRTLVIGSGPTLSELQGGLDEDPRAGYEVVATLDGPAGGSHAITAWLNRVQHEVDERQVDAVAVSRGQALTSEAIQRLAWRLEGPSVELLVAPALGDVTGPRINIRPAAGLPLLHLEEPRLTGPKALVKRLMDVTAAGLGLLVISPFLLMIGLTVRLTSPGPALFFQERVGRAGQTYRLVKFRTMYKGSEQKRQDVLGSIAGDPEAYRNDPRITRFGEFLRRWSLDELPQLWNVLTGSMSLVGPRPMLLEELTLLDTVDHRRHITKPGITGLWQVSGRKEVQWSERMHMDLRYVESWSPALDLVILAKTVKAVASGRGAH